MQTGYVGRTPRKAWRVRFWVHTMHILEQMIVPSGAAPEGKFYHSPQYEPDKHSFLASCQFLLELPESLNHFAERGCCRPPSIPQVAASWLLCTLAGLLLPTLPGKDPVYGPALFFSKSCICLNLFSPQELLWLQENKKHIYDVHSSPTLQPRTLVRRPVWPQMTESTSDLENCR